MVCLFGWLVQIKHQKSNKQSKVSKIIQQAKELAAKPDNLGSIPEPTWQKYFQKLHLDLLSLDSHNKQMN